MDKKKKIIVVAVGATCVILLVAMFKFLFFPSEEKTKTSNRVNKLSISTPKVNDKKIDRTSKIDVYKREELQNSKKNDVVKGFTYFDETNEDETPKYDPIIAGKAKRKTNIPRVQKSGKRNVRGFKNRTTGYDNEDTVDEEMREIMKLQEQLLEQSRYPNDENSQSDMQDIQKLLDAYNKHSQKISNLQQPQSSLLKNLNPESITELGIDASKRINNSIKDKFKNKSYFHGATGGFRQDEVLDLIPAETVDQGIINNGSTIAIRTKREIKLSSPPVLIPKGAVVYGKVNIGANRLLIDIESYKDRNKLYKLDFSMYDFDGVEGVHIGNRTWPKIPSKVAKDVYDYAYQRGTQSQGQGVSIGGANNTIQLDEAKDIAILSASKEIGKEIFEKRRVFIPKKYHLWINVNSKEEEQLNTAQYEQ